MRLHKLGTITNNTNVEIDLRGHATLAPLEGKEVVICFATEGVTGLVKLQEDATGGEADARAYTDMTDATSGSSLTIDSVTDGVQMFNAKLGRYLQLNTTVSAGTCHVYALES